MARYEVERAFANFDPLMFSSLVAEISLQLALAAVDHSAGMLLGHYNIELQKIKS